MAAAAQFPKPEGGANRAVAGAAGGQPAASHGLCAQGRPERCLVRAQRAGGLAALANVATTCPGQWCPQASRLRRTSRLMVEGERSIRLAILRRLRPWA